MNQLVRRFTPHHINFIFQRYAQGIGCKVVWPGKPLKFQLCALGGRGGNAANEAGLGISLIVAAKPWP